MTTTKDQQILALAGLIRGIADRPLAQAEVDNFETAFDVPDALRAPVSAILQERPGQK